MVKRYGMILKPQSWYLGQKYMRIVFQNVLMAAQFVFVMNLLPLNMLFIEWVIHQISYVPGLEIKISLNSIWCSILVCKKLH